jgi:hypothetical protein
MSKIEQPSHYQGRGGLNANQVIRAFELNFALGNVVKYVLRAGRKPDEPALDDLRKALWYLQDEFKQRELAQCLPASDLKGFAAREAAGAYGRVDVPREQFIASMSGGEGDDD